MKAKLRLTIVATATLITAGSGCRSMLSQSSRNVAPGTEEFRATHGRYFPGFLGALFQKSYEFEQDFPFVDGVRAGIHVVQVRRLSQAEDWQEENEGGAVWSARGYEVGYEVSTSTGSDIVKIDLLTGSRQRLATDGSFARGLRWSWDDQRYLYVSSGTSGDFDIYIANGEGVPRLVAPSPMKDGYATWSPDGKRIAFVSARTGGGDIYVVAADGGTAQRLTATPECDMFPEWLVDGSAIVFSSGPSYHQSIYIVHRDAAGNWGKPEAISSWPGDNLRPIASPDGRSVAFYSSADATGANPSSNWDLVVMPLAGTGSAAEPIFSSATDTQTAAVNRETFVAARGVVLDLESGFAWTPDSRKIFYVKRDEAHYLPIAAVDLDTHVEHVVETGTKLNHGVQMSRHGVLSFRAQVGAWERVFVALTNQGIQIQAASGLDMARSKRKSEIR